jgi:flagella basal body P-ring formation protein FlgA
MCQFMMWTFLRLLQLLLVGLGVLTLPAQANPSPAETATLMDGARRWLVQQHGNALSASRFEALDPRLRIPACAAGWRYDHPFSSTTTVRARCAEPQSQLYLSLSNQTAAPEPRPRQAGSAVGQSLEVYRLRSPARAGEWITADRIETLTVAALDAPPRPLGGPLPDRIMLNRDLPAGSTLRQTDLAKFRKVLISNVNISRGTVLRADQFNLTEVDGLGLPPQVVDEPQLVADAELIRDLPAGQILRMSDIRPAVMVRKGQTVRLSLGQGAALAVTATMEALQDGRRGEIIKLKNPESGRVVNGMVTGQSLAQGL